MSLMIARQLFLRELGNRFSANITGGLWAILQPLLQLSIYAFVFVTVFKARVPGEDAPDYVAYLAVAFWPWTAFAEAFVRATTAVHDNAALIGKVAFPRELLIAASVCASFVVHVAGFVAVVFVLALMGKGVHLAYLVPALMLFIPLWMLALGGALAFSAIQVFVRDLAQVLAQLIQLLMFCAPIYYDRALLPAAYRPWLDVNPLTFYAESFRALLLGYGKFDGAKLLIAIAVASVVLIVGRWVFRRLDPHFEDFL